MKNIFSRVGKIFRYLTSAINTPEKWLSEWLTGKKDLSEEKALTLSAVFKCVQAISFSIAMLPVHIYKKDEDGKHKDPDHHLHLLLHTRPNKLMAAFNFYQVLLTHVLLWGNFYCEVTWNKAGGISGLWPLHPGRMHLERKNNIVKYTYTTDNGKTINFPSWKILHIKGFSLDGLIGLSVIELHRYTLENAFSIEESGKAFFDNGMNSGTVLQYPGRLRDNDSIHNLQESFSKQYAGLKNHHKPIVLEEGTTIANVGMKLADAQYIESKKYTAYDITGLFRVPPHKCGLLDFATYSNITEQNTQFVYDTLLPYIVLIEQNFNYSLFPQFQHRSHFCKFNVDGLLRGTFKDRMIAYHWAKIDGNLNTDEIREMEDKNKLPDGMGKYYLVPSNMEILSNRVKQEDKE